MADMRYVLPGSDTITLSGQAVEKLIRTGDGGAALLYLYAVKTGGSFSASQAARIFNQSEKDISASMDLLDRLGLLKYDDAPPAPLVRNEELPEYSAADIKQELDNGTVFYSLVQEVQKSLGKMLSSDDLIRLFGIYDNLGLPPEVILHLVTYCIYESGKKYGDGNDGQKRIPTIRYIEKAAFTWEREGIVTLDLAEKYLKQLDQKRNQRAEYIKVLQIRDRELSVSERKYVDGWISLGFSPDAIEIAYDKTVLKTGKLAWSYMDSIISSWNNKGLRSPEEIQAKDGKSTQSVGKRPHSQHPKASAPSQTEIDRMKKFLEKLREE